MGEGGTSGGRDLAVCGSRQLDAGDGRLEGQPPVVTEVPGVLRPDSREVSGVGAGPESTHFGPRQGESSSSRPEGRPFPDPTCRPVTRDEGERARGSPRRIRTGPGRAGSRPWSPPPPPPRPPLTRPFLPADVPHRSGSSDRALKRGGLCVGLDQSEEEGEPVFIDRSTDLVPPSSSPGDPSRRRPPSPSPPVDLTPPTVGEDRERQLRLTPRSCRLTSLGSFPEDRREPLP